MKAPYSIKGKTVEFKTFPFQLKSVDEDQGVVTGYLSTFGNVDLGKDRVLPGAFKKTLQDAYSRKQNGRAMLFPMLWMHLPEQPIGGFIDAKEDAQGLLVTAQMDISVNKAGFPNNPVATMVFSGLKSGFIDEMSMGYIAIQKEYDKAGIRNLKECALIEGSSITMNFAMNPEALVPASGVKHALLHSGKRGQFPMDKKDFNDHYREEVIEDWMWADFQNLVSALQLAILDLFLIGDEPQSDIETTVLNDGDNSPGFITALKNYVQKGIDLDVSNYLNELMQSTGCTDPDRLMWYMSRNNSHATKAGRTISAATQSTIEQHQQEMKAMLDDHQNAVADHVAAMQQKVSSLTQLWAEEGQGSAYGNDDDSGKSRFAGLARREPRQALPRSQNGKAKEQRTPQPPRKERDTEELTLDDLESLLV